MALKNEITPIRVCSVEWSDCSVPIQKYTFGSLSLLKRNTVRSSERAHAGQSTHRPLTRFSQCMPFEIFVMKLRTKRIH